MSQDELQKALRVARQAHSQGYEPTPTLIALGALLRAVEILADRKDKPATDKRIEELEREQRECLSLITESNLVMPGRTLVDAVRNLIDLHGSAKKKVAELEKEVTRQQGVIRLQNKTMEDHVSRSVYESTVADLRAKVDGLEKSLAHAHQAIRETAALVPNAPITVDGKTPGEVLILAQHGCRPSQVSREMLESAERDALAVIRAFGQPSQTTQDAADALRRVRHQIQLLNIEDLFSFTMSELRRVTGKIIDDEIAKLAGPKQAPTSDHVHELGSCSFCDKPPPDTSTELGLTDPVLRRTS